MKRKLKIAIDACCIRSDGGINHLNNILKFVDLSKENISKVYIWSFKESKLNFDSLLNIDHIPQTWQPKLETFVLVAKELITKKV